MKTSPLSSLLARPLGLIASLCAGLTITAAQANPAAGTWQIKPHESPVVLNGFTGAADLSGLAMTGSHVLVGSDELTTVQQGLYNAESGEITFRAPVYLVHPGATGGGKGGKKKKNSAGEIDIEGVCYAAAEKAFYVTGSHGVGKKKGDFQQLRYGVYRIPFDEATGTVQTGAITQSSLLPWLTESAEFKAHVRQPLQQNGFNIEGVAHRGDRLYFGVRGPSLEGAAFIIEVEAKALFASAGQGIKPVVHRVPLGDGTGIREITAVKDGLLLLSGNAAAEPVKEFPETTAPRPDTGFALHFLPLADAGKPGAVQRIGDVSAPGGKAEGLLVLSEEANELDILVIHDGIEQGGATRYVLTSQGSPVLTTTAAAEPAAEGAAAPLKKEAQPVIRTVAAITDCPAAVQEAVKKNGHDKQLTEIKSITAGSTVTYVFETGDETSGSDDETNYFYSSEGVLLKTEKDIPLKSAPAKVQEALLKLAGKDAVVDDVETVTTADNTVTYKAELESNGGMDRKVRVSAEGEVLELTDETDD